MRAMWMVLAVAVLAVAAWWGLSGSDEREGAPRDVRREPVPVAPAEKTAPALEGRTREERGESAPPGTKATAEPHAGERELTGLVVEEAEKPVRGATVVLRIGEEGAIVATAESDADGAFRLRTTLPAGGAQVDARVEASHEGRAAWRRATLRMPAGSSYVPPTVQDLGKLVLAETVGLSVEVTSTCAGAPPASVWILDFPLSGGPGVARTRTDAEGSTRIDGLAPGWYRVVAGADGCGRAADVVKVPRPPEEPVRLTLGAERTVEVTVVDKNGGAPIAGATVSVLESFRRGNSSEIAVLGSLPREVRTDASGRVLLHGLAETDVLQLSAWADDYPLPSGRYGSGPGVARVKAGATEARIELVRVRTITWPVKAGAHPTPSDGAVIRLTPWTNSGVGAVPPEGRMEAGRLVVSGWAGGHAAAYAHAEDGSIARLQAKAGEDVGYETEFFPVRTIRVSVRAEDGTPLSGWRVGPYDQGNNPVVPPVTTDEAGRATIPDLYGGQMNLVDVRVSPPGSAAYGFAIGSVDLEKGDGDLEAVIPAEREVVLRVRIDGVPALPPPTAQVFVNGASLASPVVWDTAASTARFRARPAPRQSALHLSIFAPGFLTEGQRAPLGPPGSPVQAEMDLRSTGTVRVKVIQPQDGKYKLVLQPYDEAKGAWGPVPEGNVYGPGQPTSSVEDGRVVVSGVRPGRYRAADSSSGATSAEVVVSGGGPAAETTLDLSRAGWIRGTVEVPAGESPTGIGVGSVDATPPSSGMSVWTDSRRELSYTDKDGAFWYRTTGEKPVRLRGWHALWVPAADGGVAEVSGPREGVVLRMERGAVATLRFDRPVMAFLNPGQERGLAFRLYAGAVGGTPAHAGNAILSADGLNVRFGGAPPGTYTLWLDAAPFLPVAMAGVTLGTANVDLGEAKVSEGSRFVLSFQIKPGESAPRHHVSVASASGPPHVRTAENWGSRDAVVTGIGAGRFRVTAHPYSGSSPGLDEEIEFDGRTEVRRTIDLR